MLDLKFIRANPDTVRTMLTQRNLGTALLDELIEYDEKWRGVLVRLEELKHRQNIVGREISRLKKKGEDV